MREHKPECQCTKYRETSELRWQLKMAKTRIADLEKALKKMTVNLEQIRNMLKED